MADEPCLPSEAMSARRAARRCTCGRALHAAPEHRAAIRSEHLAGHRTGQIYVRRMYVAHADWGASPTKQYVAVAERGSSGRWSARSPRPIGRVGSLRSRLGLPTDAPAVAGFDFPIGVPRAYAAAAGVAEFIPWLRELGTGRWETFFDVAEAPHEITLARPFYPFRPGGTSQTHLTDALGLSMDELRRRCERRQPARGAACVLFWTLGGNQVGKGALVGWKLLQMTDPLTTAFWPFDGELRSLNDSARLVVAETYPAEFYGHLGLPAVVGKTRRENRLAHGPTLLNAASTARVDPAPDLQRMIEDGFGSSPAGEDMFDAFVGLLGMIRVMNGDRASGVPTDDAGVMAVEGWILGQAAG